VQDIYALLINALACAMTGKPFALPKDIQWPTFLKLCKAHAVTPLVYDGFQKAGLLQQLPQQVQNALSGAYFSAIFQDSQLEHTKAQLAQRLEEANIRHIFLKGICLKKNYPVPALRTMCDIDVLVHTDDYPAIKQVALAMGGVAGHSDGNHRNYRFPGGVEVEFHPNLIHQETPVGTQINPGWQYATPDKTGAAGELTEEGFYLNTICHMANHFVAGGVGVRFVLDVWVSRHLRQPQPDRGFIEKELERFCLLEFTRNIEALAEAWFTEGVLTEELTELAEYILTSGSHGTSARAMLNAVVLSPGGTQTSALMKRAFYSRAEMEDRFPWCKGKPWLLPIAWLVRAFRAVKNHGKLILQWGKGTGDVTKTQVTRQKEKLKRFGISHPKDKE